jgi:UDP-GlcNAc:undecaprenyl-phosphate/decaprenyl-phosphate GlcNAc-1-phosphate transferase
MPRELSFALVFAVAAVACYLLTHWAAAFGRRTGIIDNPRPGEVQSRVIPRTGGYALFFGFLIAVLLGAYLIPRSEPESRRLLGVLLGALAILPLAYMDDKRRLGPLPQLAGQIVVAAIPISFGVVADSIATPVWGTISLPIFLIVPFTVVWIVGMINTMNLVDVMDGLAAGVAAIAAIVLFARGVFDFGQYDIAILPAALAGVCIGFLPRNFHPARIFMGSSGSMLLGYSLAVMAIMGGAKVATALLVLGVPIADVAWVIIRRLAAGRSPMLGGDQRHLPQRLYRAGLTQRQIVLSFYALCAIFGLAAARFTPIGKVFAFVVLAITMAAVLFVLARRDSHTKAGQNS